MLFLFVLSFYAISVDWPIIWYPTPEPICCIFAPFLTSFLVIDFEEGVTTISELNTTVALLKDFWAFLVNSLFKLSGTKYPWIFKPKSVFYSIYFSCQFYKNEFKLQVNE